MNNTPIQNKYRFIKTGKKQFKSEHRMIMENYLQRELQRNEHVHHINGNKSDNRISNLMIVSPNKHRKIHLATAGKPTRIIEAEIITSKTRKSLITRRVLCITIKRSESTINRWEKLGLPVYKVGTGKPRYDLEEVLKWMRSTGRGAK